MLIDVATVFVIVRMFLFFLFSQRALICLNTFCCKGYRRKQPVAEPFDWVFRCDQIWATSSWRSMRSIQPVNMNMYCRKFADWQCQNNAQIMRSNGEYVLSQRHVFSQRHAFPCPHQPRIAGATLQVWGDLLAGILSVLGSSILGEPLVACSCLTIHAWHALQACCRGTYLTCPYQTHAFRWHV